MMDYDYDSSDDTTFFEHSKSKKLKTSRILSDSSDDIGQDWKTGTLEEYLRKAAEDKQKVPVENLVSLNDQMTAKEKNRAHAKNTRIRKKFYIESLKSNIQALVEEKNKLELEQKVKEENLLEKNALRKNAINSFFAFRCQSSLESTEWLRICEPNFVCLLPVTPYRSFPPIEINHSQRCIRGIQGIIFDTKSIDVLLKSLVVPKSTILTKIDISYAVHFEDSLMVNDCIMGKWEINSTNCVTLGFKEEIHIVGMFRAMFSQSHLIEFLEMSYDIMGLMQQLHKIVGRSDYLVIPNTPHFAEEPSSDARVIMEGVYPYRIIYVTDQWTKLFGYTSEESVGNTLKMLEGNLTEQDKVKEMMHYISLCMPHVSILTHVTKSGEIFLNWIKVFPLYTNGVPTHFLAVMEKLDYISDHSYLQLFNSVAGVRNNNSEPKLESSKAPRLLTNNHSFGNNNNNNSQIMNPPFMNPQNNIFPGNTMYMPMNQITNSMAQNSVADEMISFLSPFTSKTPTEKSNPTSRSSENQSQDNLNNNAAITVSSTSSNTNKDNTSFPVSSNLRKSKK